MTFRPRNILTRIRHFARVMFMTPTRFGETPSIFWSTNSMSREGLGKKM